MAKLKLFMHWNIFLYFLPSTFLKLNASTANLLHIQQNGASINRWLLLTSNYGFFRQTNSCKHIPSLKCDIISQQYCLLIIRVWLVGGRPQMPLITLIALLKESTSTRIPTEANIYYAWGLLLVYVDQLVCHYTAIVAW